MRFRLRYVRSSRGFTLIELLVVISIIALLLSVLMPALSSARQQAKLTMCQANCKQLGLMVSLYQAANNGDVPIVLNPWAGGIAPGKGTHLSLALQDYIYTKRPYSEQFSDYFAELGGGGWIVDYYENHLSKFFVCPFSRGKKADPVDPWSSWGQISENGNTFYTSNLKGFAEGYATWIGYKKKGRVMTTKHFYGGEPHGVLRYGTFAWYSRSSLAPGAVQPNRYDDLKPAKWSSTDVNYVKSGSLAETAITYCLYGETLNWGPSFSTAIMNYGSHKKAKRGGTVALFGDNHVGWVIGSQIGTK